MKQRGSIWQVREFAKWMAGTGLLFLCATEALSNNVPVTELLKEPAVSVEMKQAFGDHYSAFIRALIDPRISTKQNRDQCSIHIENGYRIAFCGAYKSDPYGAGYIVVNKDASQYIAGYAVSGTYTIRVSDDWVHSRPDFVANLMKKFISTLPIGVIGRINE